MILNKVHRILDSIPIKRSLHTTCRQLWNLPKHITIDENYYCNPQNISTIERNIEQRKGVGNIKLVNELYSKLRSTKPEDPNYGDIEKQFYAQCALLPNNTHPAVSEYGDKPKVLRLVGEKRHFDCPIKSFHDITKRLNLVRTEQLGNLSGSRSYYLLGEMAELEQALVRFFLSELLKTGFQLVSVPDILPRNVVESCGMNTLGERTQVYTLDSKLHGPDLCLSGTSEIALAGFLANKVLDASTLPLKLCAVSRCYRAEVSSVAEERGIFRVHEFTKVEMFVVSLPEQSEQMLEDIRSLQEDLFTNLDLHFQVLDMPPHDLGPQAYRKYDIEAWMPGRNIYGEISSSSNCTDFQARRLNIKYKKPDGTLGFAHTLNGTACAIPRLLIALMETHQQHNGVVLIPQAIQKFLYNKTKIGRQKKVPELKLVKNKQ